MANEFVARNGLIALDNSSITGSLGVTGGITGSLFGTASWANNAVSASFATTALSASYFSGSISTAITAETASFVTSSNVVGPYGADSILTASYAVTAAFALNGGGGGLSGGTQYYVPLWTGASSLGTSSLFESASVLKTVSASVDAGLILDFKTNNYILGNIYTGNFIEVASSVTIINNKNITLGDGQGSYNSTYIELDDTNQYIKTINQGNDVGLKLDFANNQYLFGDLGGINNFNLININDSANLIELKTDQNNDGTILSISGSLLKTIYQSNDIGLKLDFANASYSLGDFNNTSGSTKLVIDDNARRITISGSTVISGSLNVTNGITGSLFGTASWAQNAITASNALTASYVLNAVSSSFATTSSFSNFAATASYATNITISGSISNVDYIDFDTTVAFTNAVGRLGWDSGEGTLQLGLVGGNVTAQVGQDLFQYVYNATGAPLTKGTVVYISGSQGNRIAVKLASSTAEQGSANTLGFVAEAITTGATGWVQTEGVMRKLDTSGLVGGQLLYLSSSAGQYTQTKPQAPLHEVRLGYAERIDATVGSIYIKIDNGYELDELHNVLITSESSGDLLVQSGSLWINSKQLTGSYALTGSLRATTINTTYLTASGNNYPTNPGTSSYFLQTDGAGNLNWNYVRSVLESVKNVGATTLVKGTPVYVTSSVGNTAEVLKADAASGSLMPATYILNETLTAGQQGLGIVLGFINNIDTSAFNESDQIYVAAGGGYTNVQPTGSVLIQPLGTVVRVDNTNGSIMVSNTGVTNSLPNINPGHAWVGNNDWLPTATPTSSFRPYIDNLITVGLSGSATNYNVIKTAIDSITDASANNTYTVKVYPGVYIEDTITLKSFVSVIGDGPESTIVSASNPSASIFLGADQSFISDMKIQGVTAPSQSAILYYTSQSVASQGILYVENVRFGSNYTHAKMYPVSGGNAAMQLTNVKYGAQPFTLGFYITSDGISTGRMLLRNVTTTAGGIQSTTGLTFAKTDQPNCTIIANLVGLTKVGSGPAQGIGFWAENGGLLRINTANLQRFDTGIYVPQVGSAPTIDAVGLNFENCTTDVNIIHTGSIGKVAGTDNFLKTLIPYEAPLYEVNQDQRRITVAKKGGDFNSISASVAYITDSSETNRYVIDVGPGEFFENQIDLRGRPYVSIVGSNIQATHIMPSGSGNFDQILLGPTNEVSFLSLMGYNNPGYAGIVVDGTGDEFAQAHKVSIYDFDYGIKVLSTVSSSTFYGEYIDINGPFSYGTYVSASSDRSTVASIENYYLFPSGGISTGNYAIGPGSELDLYTCLFVGDNVSGSTAISLTDGAVAEVAGLDAQNWEYGIRVPNVGSAPTFRMVGAMIHNSITYDFFVEKTGTQGRYQGIANHQKINNVSEDFYWNFLDDEDGENDVTRKLSVTFADGTHTDATTLIFMGSSMGVLSGGEITISGSLTVTTAAGYGYLHDPINPDVFKRFDWVNQNITLSPNTNNYIYINSNGVLSAAGTTPNFAQNIILGRVVTNDTGVEFIDQSPWNAEHTANRLSKFNREALGPVFAEGSTVTEDAVPFKLDVTQGNYYFSENNFLPAGTASINLTQYYQSASVWARYTSSVVPNNVYASGSALVPMSASHYTKHTVYLVGDGADEEYFLVINNNQYATLVEAEGASLPTIPTYFNDGVVPLAAIYVQSGSANITQIEDIRPIIGFRAAGVNASAVHGNLLGLSADDHTQYLLVDGGRQMAGDLGLGGNDLYNFASVSGSSITASGAIITNINATTVTATSFTGSLQGNADSATTASYVLNAVSASFASTASFVTTAQTASYILQAISASFASTASNILGGTTNYIPIWSSNTTLGNSSMYQSSSNIGIGTTSPGGINATSSKLDVRGTTWFSADAYGQLEIIPTIGNGGQTVIRQYTSTPRNGGDLRIRVDTAVQGGNFIVATNNNTERFRITSAGNTLITGSLSVTQGITGSLFGTASWAQNAVTASFITNAVSASFASTASSADNFLVRGTLTAQTIVAQTITSSTDFVTGSTKFGTLLSNTHQFTGSVSITGSLTTNGDTIIRGSGNTSATTALTVQNSSANELFRVRNDGLNWIGNAGANAPRLFPFTTGYSSQNLSGTNISIYTAGDSFASSNGAIALGGDIMTSTSSAQINVYSIRPFQPTSGTATFTNFQIVSTINQTGGANGITRGLYILTNLTAAADWRSIEWNNNTGRGLYGAGSAANVLSGSTTIGSLTTGSSTLNVVGTTNLNGNTVITGSLTVVTGSAREFEVTSIGINIGSVITDTHTVTGSLNISGSITATNFTGSLFGTSSWAQNAVTASYILNAVSASLATTASYALVAQTLLGTVVSASYAETSSIAISASFASTASFVQNAQSASYILNAVSSSYAFTASSAVSASFASTALSAPAYLLTSATASMLAPYLLSSLTSSFITTSQTSSMSVATASYVLNAVSSSFAPTALNANTASYVLNAVSSSYAFTASSAVSSSFASTALTAPAYLLTSATASMLAPYILNSQTASMTVLSASFASTASFVTTAQTASYVLNAISSSYAFTASSAISASFAGTALSAPAYLLTSATASMLAPYVLNSQTSSMTVLSASFASTASFVQNAQSASYVLNAVSSSYSFTASSAVSSSFALSASFAPTNLAIQDESSPQGLVNTINFTGAGVTATVGGGTATVNIPGGAGAAFPFTGSAVITGSLVVTGSVTSTLGFTGSLFGTSSWAQNAVTASYVLQAVSSSFATTSSFALTASYALNAGASGLATKAGSVANTSFTGNPRKATVTFGTAFGSTNYAIVITGEDARSWTIESKLAGSFVISANSNVGLTGTTYWIATAYGETT